MAQTTMIELQDVDLRSDPTAVSYIKHETVTVEFATQPGRLGSSVGANAYVTGDALLTGADGDRWSVSRDRFNAGYEPVAPTVAGQAGRYRNRPRPVLARRMHGAFRCARSAGGDWLQGAAGDWLLQYAPGDHGIATNARFMRVYQREKSSS